MMSIRAALLLLCALAVALAAGRSPARSSAWQDEARLAALLARHRPVSEAADIALLGKDGTITAARALEAAAKDLDDAKLARGAVEQLAAWVEAGAVRAVASEALATAARAAKDAGVRRRAIELLAEKRGERSALRAVFDGSSEAPLRALALKGMVAQGPFDEELRRLCARTLFDPKEIGEVRAAAFDAPPFREKLSTDDLLKLGGDADAGLRLRALKRLREENERAAQVVAKERLGDASAPVQIECGRILLASGVPVNALLVLDHIVGASTQVRDALHPQLLERASASFLSGLEQRLAQTDLSEHAAKVLTRVLGDLARKQDAAALRLARKLLLHPQTFVRARLAEALADAKDRGSIGALTKLLRSGMPHVRVEGLRALTAIQGQDPELAKLLLEALGDKDVAVRIAAVDCLAQVAHPLAAPRILALLDPAANSEPALRLAALDALVTLRHAPAIPVVIEALASASGRYAEDYAQALRLLTNQPFRRHAPDWRRWWADHGASFVPPPLDEAQKQELAFRARQREAGSTSSFYGLEILSERVVFVIDQSGSMGAKAGTRSSDQGGKTRLQIAKEELLRYVDNVPEHHLFNIVLFGTGVRTFADDMRSPKGPGRAEARQWVEKIALEGATNLYGGLKKAFAMKDVDTIYLLTDGDPSVGEEVDPKLILEDVTYWNRERRIVIHSISIGTRSELLRKLAEETGGEFLVR
jgi:hypothetical protein